MLTPQQEQQVQNACYAIGSKQIGPWLRRIIELENEVTALKALIGSLAQARETANV
jgi:hypothetical protein